MTNQAHSYSNQEDQLQYSSSHHENSKPTTQLTDSRTLQSAEQEQHLPRSYVSNVPPGIVQAICKIQTSLDKSVEKKGTNAFGKYAFVSVDDIFATLAKRMGEAELSILTLETGAKEERIGSDQKTALFCTFTFQFVLATPDGTWTDPNFIRTVRTHITGPQSYAAAQSFAEKAMLRSIFKLPTGDAELDELKQADTQEDQADVKPQTRRPGGQRQQRKSSAAAKRDGDMEDFERIRNQIDRCDCPSKLQELYNNYCINGLPFGDFPKDWAGLLCDDYSLRLQDLTVSKS